METTHGDKSIRGVRRLFKNTQEWLAGLIEPNKDPAYALNPPTPEEVEAQRQVVLALLELDELVRGFQRNWIEQKDGVIILRPGDPRYDLQEEARNKVDKAQRVLNKLQEARQMRIRQFMVEHQGEDAGWPVRDFGLIEPAKLPAQLANPETDEEKKAWRKVLDAAARTRQAAAAVGRNLREGGHGRDESANGALQDAMDAESEARAHHSKLGQERAARIRRAIHEENFALAAAAPAKRAR